MFFCNSKVFSRAVCRVVQKIFEHSRSWVRVVDKVLFESVRRSYAEAKVYQVELLSMVMKKITADAL